MVKTDPASKNDDSLLFDAKTDTRFQVRQICPEEAGNELKKVCFDESYRPVAEKKFHHVIIKASELSAPGANILKQTCLTLGAEAGVHKGAINCTIDREAVLITATRAQLKKLILKLRPQPFGLSLLAESLTRMLQRQKRLQKMPLQAMAILNLTPDSFSDGGRFHSLDQLLTEAGQALDLGVKILDVGGESTRPGATTLPLEEEFNRVIPAIEALHRNFPNACISIDTRKSEIAKAALNAGASIVNDVSGLTFDPNMASIVAQTACPVILMHHQGTPETMQLNPTYEDVMGEISQFFYQQVAYATEAGIHSNNIILDPGFGFGKTLAHNLELMRRLPELVSIGFPILVGTSRKSFLTLGDTNIPVDQRECLTAASLAIAAQSGVKFVRIHNPATQMPVINWLSQVYSH